MKQIPSTPERCDLLLSEWRKYLRLSSLEKSRLSGELKVLDRQLDRLKNKYVRIAVFGRVGVGKSSLLNALVGKSIFNTDVANGCTRNLQATTWVQAIYNLSKIELLDTPGIDEIAKSARARLAARIALQADLVLLVLDSDITRVELESLQTLISSGKPILMVLNRCDQWGADELNKLKASIKKRLPINAQKIPLYLVSAAPREAFIQKDGKIRSRQIAPRIEPLRKALQELLTSEGELFLGINALRQAIAFDLSLKTVRLQKRKADAQSVIGKFAAIKASAVAVNPLMGLDMASGLACDTALILELTKLYELNMEGYKARELLKEMSMQNAFLGGAQLTIQLFLGLIRHMLLLITPITSGISLATATPVAIAQAALAVHTTKVIGKLTVQSLFNSKQSKVNQPDAMLRRLSINDPGVSKWISEWPKDITTQGNQLQTLLP